MDDVVSTPAIGTVLAVGHASHLFPPPLFPFPQVENRELKHEVARLRSLVEALAAHHPAAAAAAAQHAAALAAARSAAALMPAPGLVAVDSSWSEPSSSLPTEDGSF